MSTNGIYGVTVIDFVRKQTDLGKSTLFNYTIIAFIYLNLRV